MECDLTIPDLAPATRFSRLRDSQADFDFSFEVKRQAIGPYITAKWGWDEALQRDFHRQRFTALPLFKITETGAPIGTIAVYHEESWIRIGEFYLAPRAQKQGRGTRILRHCLELAASEARPVRLEYLTWNPVGTLYRREGFTEIGENENHFFLEWRA
tara:strand:+ start:539 stop:1012 length:474 start_codon:yes stop_codon:yes gene_type:complete